MSESRVLRLAYRAFPAFESALGRQVAAFRAVHPDVRIELHDFDFPSLHASMVKGDELLSGEWDAVLCASDWLPRLIRDNKLQCLDDLLETLPPPDWRRGWSETLLTLQTDCQARLFGLPYHDGPEMLLYRADLFGDPEEQRRFREVAGAELLPPTTWDEFLEVATFFTRPDRDLYGCAVAAKPDGHNNVYDFLIHLGSRGGHAIRDGQAAFQGPEGRAALQYLANLVVEQQVTQPNPRMYDSVGSGEVYAAGRAAMMWNWCGFAAMSELPGSNVAGRTRLTIVPRGAGPAGRHVSFSAYWVMTIPRSARDIETSWAFLRWLATPEMDRLTALEGAIGCRRSTWEDPDIRQRFSCYALIEEAHRHAQTVPNIPEYDDINAVLNEAIDSVYLGRLTVEDALASAARDVDALLT